MPSEFIEFDATPAEHHLLFKRKRNRAVVGHAEGNLDALQRVARIDLHRFILSLRDRYRVVKNDSDDLMDGDLGLREDDRLRRVLSQIFSVGEEGPG